MNRVAAIIISLCLLVSLIEAKPHFLSKKRRGRGIGGNEQGGKSGGLGGKSGGPDGNNHGPGGNSHGSSESSESGESQCPLEEVRERVDHCLAEFFGGFEEFGQGVERHLGSWSWEPSWNWDDFDWSWYYSSWSDWDWSYYGSSDWGCDDDDPVCRVFECVNNAFHGEPDDDDPVCRVFECVNNAFHGEPGHEFPSHPPSDVLYNWPSDSYWLDANMKKEAAHNADMKKKATHNAARAQKAKKMMAKKSSIMKAMAQKRANV